VAGISAWEVEAAKETAGARGHSSSFRGQGRGDRNHSSAGCGHSRGGGGHSRSYVGATGTAAAVDGATAGAVGAATRAVQLFTLSLCTAGSGLVFACDAFLALALALSFLMKTLQRKQQELQHEPRQWRR